MRIVIVSVMGVGLDVDGTGTSDDWTDVVLVWRLRSMIHRVDAFGC